MDQIDNLPARLAVAVYPGATLRFDIAYGTDAVPSVPVDLTGAAVRLLACRADGSTMFDLTAGAGLTVDAASGTVVAAIPAVPPADRRAGQYVLSVTYPSGDVDALLAGSIGFAAGPPAGVTA